MNRLNLHHSNKQHLLPTWGVAIVHVHWFSGFI